MSDRRRVVVVGAGITGLTAAFTLATQRPDLDIVLLEASERVGGKILTTPFAGRPVDCGPDAFLARVPEAIELCRELGLETILTSPSQKSAFVWVNGGLHRLPAGLVLGVPTDLDALVASGIVSADGIARAAQDLTRTEWIDSANGADPNGVDDQSVGQLIRARLGDEVHEKLVSPLLSGVNAGDADHLSLAAGAAQIAVAARRSPSLITALRDQLASAKTDPELPVFRGIPVGTQTLTDLLLARLTKFDVSVHLSCPVSAITRDGSTWSLATSLGAIAADEIVLATPARPTARLLESLAPEQAAELANLDYASAAMVTLAVSKNSLGVPLDASGFLVAQTDPLPTLTACSWASAKWAHLDDPEVAILRISAGKHGDTHALELDDPSLVQALVLDLATTMGIDAPPVEWRVT
ncbi:MAG: protoporphyrinogen oxidase, partial [Actinobacteria bacterium]|nr:protoporphyrinogen oxidase [Actinomycetota bacterium]